MSQGSPFQRTGSTHSIRANTKEDDIKCRQRKKTTSGSTTRAEASRTDRQSSTGYSRTPSPASSRKSVLGLSSGNSVPVSKKLDKQSNVKRSSRKESASATVNTADANKALPTSQPYIPLKVVLQKGSRGDLNEHDSLRNKWSNEVPTASNSNALLTSFMASGKSKGNQTNENGDKSGEIEMDFLNVINISAIGSFFCTHTDMYFGNAPKSAACKMNLDTGSSLTWINKRVYTRKCGETGASFGKRLHIQVSFRYLGMTQDFIGELCENVVSFGSENTTIEKQRFVVVDEEKVPVAKTWRKDFGTIGILGLGLSTNAAKHVVVDDPRLAAPSVSYQLLQKKAPAARVVGLNINIPSDPGDNVTSGSTPATVMGELHFGGFKRSAFSPNEPKWVAANRTEWGSRFVFALNMKINYDGKVFSDEYPAIMDTGAAYTYLPRELMYKYITTVGQGRKIFHYDSTLKAHYIFKSDFDKLSDMVFHFEGADIMFPTQAQVIPSGIFKQWEPSANDEYLYLTLRNLPPNTTYGSKPVILLGHTWISRYYLIMDNESKKIGIAEVEGKTNYVWKELRDLVSKSSS